jgi:serine/threonine-protein kinase
LIGIAVGLYFALRPKGVTVPKVVGMKLADAKAALVAKALTPVEQKVEITGAHPPGEVTAQSPEPGGSPVPKNTQVNLTTEGEVPLVEVPDVTKRLVEDARELLKKESLGVVEKSTDVSPGLQPNQVVSQDPVGGTKVKLPTTVTLVVAVQREVVVPDVVFKPLGIAEQQITAAGLRVVEKDPELAPPNVAPGNVKSQNPPANTKVPPGSAVELVAAAQPTSVPDVRGRRIADAQIILQQASLDLGTVSGTVNTTNASTVLITGQDPGAGTSVARGARVNVSVPFICSVFRACISIDDRIDISTVRRLDPAIKRPLFQRKQ